MNVKFFTAVAIWIMHAMASSGQRSHLGRQFALAFPEMDRSETVLFLFTTEEDEFNVSLFRTMPETGEEYIVVNIPLRRDYNTSHLLDNSLLFTPITGTGYQGIFFLEALNPFGIHVHCSMSPSYSASFLALPVSSWGRKYYLFTLQSQPFVVMLTLHTNKVKIKFNVEPNDMKELNFDNIYYRDESSFRFRLRSMEAFILSGCYEDQIKVVSLTGSLIESLEGLGVITGSCSAYMKIEGCEHYGPHPNRDLAMEMVYPELMAGTTFYVLNIYERNSNELLVAVAVDPLTHVNVFFFRALNFLTFEILDSGGVHYILLDVENLESGSRLVNSTRPIILASITTSTCKDRGLKVIGGPSICMVLPNNLFYHTYIWRVPNYPSTRHYVALVGQANVLINSKLPKSNANLYWSAEIGGTANVFEAHYTLHLDAPDQVMVITGPDVFGCYFYGVGFGAYASPGGLYFTNSTIEECIYTIPRSGDEIDNDCDQQIDEEDANQIDDDGDGLCDEDLMGNVTGPEYSFTWGHNCANSCANCVDVCYTYDGYCEVCKSGYKDNHLGCVSACGPNEYGENCAGNCEELCGTDCKDRVTGECHETYDAYYISALSLMLIGVLMGLVYVMTKSKRRVVVRRKRKHHHHKHHHRPSRSSKRESRSKDVDRTTRKKKKRFGTKVDEAGEDDSPLPSLEEVYIYERSLLSRLIFFWRADSRHSSFDSNFTYDDDSV